MATKAEKKVLKEMLWQIETVRAWLDDTMYPRVSMEAFEHALADVKREFGVEERVMEANNDQT